MVFSTSQTSPPYQTDACPTSWHVTSHRVVPDVCRLRGGRETLGTFFFWGAKNSVLHKSPRVCFQSQVQMEFWGAGVATEKPVPFRAQVHLERRQGRNHHTWNFFIIVYLLCLGQGVSTEKPLSQMAAFNFFFFTTTNSLTVPSIPC